jgi:hypothetical protein
MFGLATCTRALKNSFKRLLAEVKSNFALRGDVHFLGFCTHVTLHTSFAGLLLKRPQVQLDEESQTILVELQQQKRLQLSISVNHFALGLNNVSQTGPGQQPNRYLSSQGWT